MLDIDMARIRVLHGPNLNLLGMREPEVYGSDTLNDINQRLEIQAGRAGYDISFLQSNAEHEIVDAVQAGIAGKIDYFIIKMSWTLFFSLLNCFTKHSYMRFIHKYGKLYI